MRFLPVSQSIVLVELADLAETLALFDSLAEQPIAGVEEIIPAARTLMISFRPELLGRGDLAGEIAGRDLKARTHVSDHVVEIPVRYDGDDLAEVAEILGITTDEVVRRHTRAEYTVAFTGFAPGFAYLTAGDAGLEVPRRKTPRTRILAGSVGLAGPFSGIYPQASPGGWQIIGGTPLAMFDLLRDPPALLQPGFRVQFRDLAKGGRHVVAPRRPAPATAAAKVLDRHQRAAGIAGFKVISAALPALFQDLGRHGRAGQGVSPSGALDQGALIAANRLVGNARGAPCLEITCGGFSFEALAKAVIALAGAACPITIKAPSGRSFAAPHLQPIALDEGDVVSLAAPPAGIRSYLAVRGGFAIEPVLGSASTDTLAHIGPPVVAAGTTLDILPAAPGVIVSLGEVPAFDMPAGTEMVTLDVIMGPRTDWFTAAGVATFLAQTWHVTPQSNRVGIRLAGDQPLERANRIELPSEGTATGAVQVPAGGQPVLFLADHPLTGGYPVIATVADHHLDLAGQIPIGARIRFNPLGPFEEIDGG